MPKEEKSWLEYLAMNGKTTVFIYSSMIMFRSIVDTNPDPILCREYHCIMLLALATHSTFITVLINSQCDCLTTTALKAQQQGAAQMQTVPADPTANSTSGMRGVHLIVHVCYR